MVFCPYLNIHKAEFNTNKIIKIISHNFSVFFSEGYSIRIPNSIKIEAKTKNKSLK